MQVSFMPLELMKSISRFARSIIAGDFSSSTNAGDILGRKSFIYGRLSNNSFALPAASII